MTAADCLVGQTDHSWQLPCSVTNTGALVAPRGGRPLSLDCRQSRRGSSQLASKGCRNVWEERWCKGLEVGGSLGWAWNGALCMQGAWACGLWDRPQESPGGGDLTS